MAEAGGRELGRRTDAAPPRRPWVCPDCAGPLTPIETAIESETERAAVCGACGFRAERRDGIWWFAPGFEPAGFPPGRREHLERLAAGHFWFPARRRLLASLVDRFVPDPAGAEAVELGCGTGSLLAELALRFAAVVGVDAYGASLAAAGRAAPAAERVQADLCRLPLETGRFRLAAALDVLEHVAPAPLLSAAARVVEPGGWLLVSVPAHPTLWSELDEAAGHRCRYTLSALGRELEGAGWRLVHWTHYQFLLLPLVWLSRRGPAAALRRLERRPPRLAARLFGAIDSFEVRTLSRARLPWGSSLVALARNAP